MQNLSLLSRYLELLYTRLVELGVVSSYTFFFSFPQSAFETNLYNSTWRETPVKKKKKKSYIVHYKILVADSISIRPNLEKLLFVFFCKKSRRTERSDSNHYILFLVNLSKRVVWWASIPINKKKYIISAHVYDFVVLSRITQRVYSYIDNEKKKFFKIKINGSNKTKKKKKKKKNKEKSRAN